MDQSAAPAASPLEGAQGAGDVPERPVPPYLYVPVRGEPEDGHVEFEMRALQDGGIVLLTFSALDRLIDGCGEHQPWVVVESPKLSEMQPTGGWDVVAMDCPLPEALRHGSPPDDVPNGGEAASTRETGVDE